MALGREGGKNPGGKGGKLRSTLRKSKFWLPQKRSSALTTGGHLKKLIYVTGPPRKKVNHRKRGTSSPGLLKKKKKVCRRVNRGKTGRVVRHGKGGSGGRGTWFIRLGY